MSKVSELAKKFEQPAATPQGVKKTPAPAPVRVYDANREETTKPLARRVIVKSPTPGTETKSAVKASVAKTERKPVVRAPVAQTVTKPVVRAPVAQTETKPAIKAPAPRTETKPAVKVPVARTETKPAVKVPVARTETRTPIALQVETKPSVQRNSVVDVKLWEEAICKLQKDQTITAEVSFKNGVKTFIPVVKYTNYFVRILKGMMPSEQEKIKNTAFCFTKLINTRPSATNLDSLGKTLAISQAIENDSRLKSAIDKEQVRAYRAAVADQFITVMTQEIANLNNRKDEEYRLIQKTWDTALHNYPLIWKCFEDDRFNNLNKTIHLVSNAIKANEIRAKIPLEDRPKKNPPVAKTSKEPEKPRLLQPIKTNEGLMYRSQWEDAINTLKKGETLSSIVTEVDGVRTLSPFIIKTRPSLIRILIGFIKGEEFRKSQEKKVNITAQCLMQCMGAQEDLDSVSLALKISQLIEYDPLINPAVGKENVLNLRKTMANQFLTVMRKEMAPTNPENKTRMQNVRKIWDASLFNHKLIWACLKDKRYPLLEKDVINMDERLHQITIREKKAKAIHSLSTQLQSITKEGEDYLKALEALAPHFKKIEKNCEIFEVYLKHYRDINRQLNALNNSLQKIIGKRDLNQLSDQNIDELAGQVADFYADQFSQVLVKFKSIMFYQRPFSRLLENKNTRHNKELEKNWWNKVDLEFRSKQESKTKGRFDLMRLFFPSTPLIDYLSIYAQPLGELQELLPETSPIRKKIERSIKIQFNDKSSADVPNKSKIKRH